MLVCLCVPTLLLFLHIRIHAVSYAAGLLSSSRVGRTLWRAVLPACLLSATQQHTRLAMRMLTACMFACHAVPAFLVCMHHHALQACCHHLLLCWQASLHACLPSATQQHTRLAKRMLTARMFACPAVPALDVCMHACIIMRCRPAVIIPHLGGHFFACLSLL
jgi:hypothetical protein